MTIQQSNNIEYFNEIAEYYPFDLSGFNFTGNNFSIVSKHRGEIRFGPSYYGIEIKDDKGATVWESSMYGGELFNHNIFGDDFQKLILVAWYSEKPADERVVAIDLKNKKEIILTEKARYFYAGHFYSFDWIFYSTFGVDDINCKNLITGETFLLFEIIKKLVPNMANWSICPVKDCIVVFTKSNDKNIFLLDIVNNKIVEQDFIEYKLSANSEINCYLDKKMRKLLVQFHDYDLDADNHMVNTRDQYFEIDFLNN